MLARPLRSAPVRKVRTCDGSQCGERSTDYRPDEGRFSCCTNSSLSLRRPSAVVINDGAAGFTAEIQFLSSGADRTRQATGAHIGRPLAILLDGHVAMTPTVRSPIGDSTAISGQFTENEAKRIAQGVRRR
jgi:hypothetical protein